MILRTKILSNLKIKLKHEETSVHIHTEIHQLMARYKPLFIYSELVKLWRHHMKEVVTHVDVYLIRMYQH